MYIYIFFFLIDAHYFSLGRRLWFGYDIYHGEYNCHGVPCWWYELWVFWICWGQWVNLPYDLLLICLINCVVSSSTIKLCGAGILSKPHGRSDQVFWKSSQGSYLHPLLASTLLWPVFSLLDVKWLLMVAFGIFDSLSISTLVVICWNLLHGNEWFSSFPGLLWMHYVPSLHYGGDMMDYANYLYSHMWKSLCNSCMWVSFLALHCLASFNWSYLFKEN